MKTTNILRSKRKTGNKTQGLYHGNQKCVLYLCIQTKYHAN